MFLNPPQCSSMIILQLKPFLQNIWHHYFQYMSSELHVQCARVWVLSFIPLFSSDTNLSWILRSRWFRRKEMTPSHILTKVISRILYSIIHESNRKMYIRLCRKNGWLIATKSNAFYWISNNRLCYFIFAWQCTALCKACNRYGGSFLVVSQGVVRHIFRGIKIYHYNQSCAHITTNTS